MLTNILQNIQKTKYSILLDEVAALKSTSETIKPSVLSFEKNIKLKLFLKPLISFKK